MEHTGIVRGHHAFDKECTICRLQAKLKAAEKNKEEWMDIARKAQQDLKKLKRMYETTKNKLNRASKP